MENFLYLLILLQKLTHAYYTLYEITAFNSLERSVLYKLHVKNKHYYFMNDVTNEAIIPINVIVKDSHTVNFEQKLQKNNIQYTKLVYEISNAFYDWKEITTLVSKTVKENVFLKKKVIAKTYEHRELFILKLSTKKNKVAVFIMGGEDGRDWLTPAIIMNFVIYLLEKKDLEILTKYYDFYFLPFMNPDGYMFNKNMNRFWSKNRKKFIPQIMCSHNYSATGVNLDRNWYFANASFYLPDQECNAVNIGQKPLSEEETEAVSYALNNLSLRMMTFINIKGFDRLITIPYANEDISVNHDIVMELITLASAKVKEKYNVTYYVGTTAKYKYNASGNVADWVKKMLNVPIVYTVYLKHKNDVLPKFDNIEPLTLQLYTILNETLTMAKDIYGPLFNSDLKPQTKFLNYFFYSLIHILYISFIPYHYIF